MEFLNQIIEKAFKPCIYSVYSIIEDDGFINELNGMFKTKYVIDNFEYLILELSEKEKNGIIHRMSFMTKKIDELKKVIEQEIQEEKNKTKSRVYVNKDKGFILIVNINDFDIKKRIIETKNSDENSPL